MTKNNDLLIPVLLGTGRDGRVTEKAAKYVFGRLKERGVHSVLVDVRDYGTSKTHAVNESAPITAGWRETMERADGLVIVAPEYNHGYPGELKIVLDALYREYDRKPVAVCSVSNGELGGARFLENLRPVLIALGMVPTKRAVYFSLADRLFEGPDIADAETYDKRLCGLFDELLWYAEALKKARAESPFA